MKDIVFLIFGNIYVIIGAVAILITVASILIMRTFLRRKYYQDIYECVDYFIRNSHVPTFYSHDSSNAFSEYKELFTKCKSHRNSWFLGTLGKLYVEKYLYWFDEVQTFIERMSSFMGEEHYFAHSEYLSC